MNPTARGRLPQPPPIDFVDAVRRRPGMYIGDPHDGSGSLAMVMEVVANAVDQHLAGHARHLRVTVDSDEWVEVEDDGAGIPMGAVAPEGRPVLEEILLAMHDRPTFDGHLPHIHLARDNRGVGLAPVSAACSRFEITTVRDGQVARVATELGQIVEHAHIVGMSRGRGTTVRFRLDPTIVPAAVPLQALAERLEELAWLHPMLVVEHDAKTVAARGGLLEWARRMARGGPQGDFVFAARRQVGLDLVELAIAWERKPNSSGPGLLTFVNSNRTGGGGTHLRGLIDGLKAVARSVPEHESRARHLERSLCRGLVGAVHVVLRSPEYCAPTRDTLRTPLARTLVKQTVQAHLAGALSCAPQAAAAFARRARGSP